MAERGTRGSQPSFLGVALLLLIFNCRPFAPSPKAAAAEISAHTEFRIRSWTKEHGLPSDAILAILQTRDGYLWIATFGGLARFDGLAFDLFTRSNTPEMLSQNCLCLAEDTAGDLWIGTNKGLLRKRGQRFDRFTLQDGLISDEIVTLCPARDGGLWIGTDSGLNRFHNGKLEKYGDESGVASGSIKVIREDPSGTVWVGTKLGLQRLNSSTHRAEFVTNDDWPFRLAVHAIQPGPQNELWVLYHRPVAAADLWLYRAGASHQPTTGQLITEREKDPQSQFLSFDQGGDLWLPGARGHLIQRHQEGFTAYSVPDLRPGDHVTSMYEDRDANLWVGVAPNGGLQRWQRRKVRVYSADDGLAHDNTWAICETRDGSIWIGTDAGLSRIQGEKVTSVTPEHGLSHEKIRALAEDAAGRLWIGTSSGLNSFTDGKMMHDHPFRGPWFESKVRSILPGQDGSLWVGSATGLHRFQDGKHTKYAVQQGLAHPDVCALLEDREGTLWVGTWGGGLQSFRNGKFTTLASANGLSNDSVTALFEDADGLWIGTERGLNRLQAGRLNSFTTREGLPDNLVNSILEDDFGQLWIGHDRGIYRVSKAQLDAVAAERAGKVQCISYDDSDGLLSIETNGQKSHPSAFKSRDGRLWFATTRGVVVFDPRRHQGEVQLQPLVIVDSVRANGLLILDRGAAISDSRWSARFAPASPAGKKIGPVGAPALHFNPGSARVLEFHFTAPNFVAPEKTRFRYKLEGLDESWSEAGPRRSAYYANLPPGNYLFQVAAGDHRGLWSQSGQSAATIAFYLAPHFYQTWWFWGGSIVSVLLAGFLLFRRRLNEVRRIQQLERERALIRQRRQIARDIHDEIGPHLAQIALISGETRNGAGRPELADDQAQRIASLAEQAVDYIGEIVWANNPKYDTLEDTVAYLREYAATFLLSTPIQATLDFPESVPARPVPSMFRRHLLLLVKEALHNMAKHSGADRATIRLTLRHGNLDLSIVDNGCGLPGSVNRFGNGLGNMRQRVEELGDVFELQSQPGKGTQIRISVCLPHPPKRSA